MSTDSYFCNWKVQVKPFHNSATPFFKKKIRCHSSCMGEKSQKTFINHNPTKYFDLSKPMLLSTRLFLYANRQPFRKPLIPNLNGNWRKKDVLLPTWPNNSKHLLYIFIPPLKKKFYLKGVGGVYLIPSAGLLRHYSFGPTDTNVAKKTDWRPSITASDWDITHWLIGNVVRNLWVLNFFFF